MSKRTLHAFFAPPAKKIHLEDTTPSVTPPRQPISNQTGNHDTYPWPIPHLPPHIAEEIELLVTAEGKPITNQPDLDLLYFQPFIPATIQRELFQFLRSELFYYRVKYSTKKFGQEILVNTPRYTTVFGLDETSRFVSSGDGPSGNGAQGPAVIVESNDQQQTKPVRRDKYKCKPRPIPQCLDLLRRVTEANTNTQYNFCLVNYYATGSDSISFHSDDEWFLGPNPAIASFSLGARRDFHLKHKPPKSSGGPGGGGMASSDKIGEESASMTTKSIKLSLASGDMVLMRGPTQSNWLHSIPKRKGGDADGGRINITFRRAMVPAGTENYYRYNVGDGGVFKWDKSKREMLPWLPLG